MIVSSRQVKSAIKNAIKAEETAKKWMSMMTRDCNRFSKIMVSPIFTTSIIFSESHDFSVGYKLQTMST